jgi:predicted phosphodiesterase
VKKVAVLADIHGNVPALEVVIADVLEQGVDEVLVGGDLVGRGPEGSKVARRVRDLGWPSVRGNHEDYLLAFRRRQVPPDWLESEEWAATRWMSAELGGDDERYLDTFPFSLSSRVAPGLRLVHASPASYNQGLGVWTTDAELEAHLDSIDETVLVCGHTHRPMLRRLGRRAVINVGAVGLPFNRDRRAQYVVLQHRGDGWDAEFRRVDYDVESVLDVYRRSGFLAQGGVTAELLRLELIHARPFVVPFIEWAKALGFPPARLRLDAFLGFYDPDESMDRFLERLPPR